MTLAPITFNNLHQALPGLSGADRLRLFEALPESVKREMEHNRAVRIADRRFRDGEVEFVSRKPKRRPARRTQAIRPTPVGWQRGTEALASIPAEVYLEILVPDTESNRGKCRCPWPDHEDNNPSCSYRDTVFFCHSCGKGGGIFQLGSALSGLGDHGDQFGDLRKWIAERVLGVSV